MNFFKIAKMNCYGSAYDTFRERVKRLNIDISHFNKIKKSKVFLPRQPISYFLQENKRVGGTTKFKKRLIEEGLLENKCYICNMGPTWDDKKLALQIDHISGNNKDNRLENLRLLCPNCHSQTPTFCVKMVIKKPKTTKAPKLRFTIITMQGTCKICKGPTNYQAKYKCKKCYNSTRELKIVWPSKEEIIERLKTSNFTALGKELGVSDNAIRKYLKR